MVRSKTVARMAAHIARLNARVTELESAFGSLQEMTAQAPLPRTELAASMELAEEIVC